MAALSTLPNGKNFSRIGVGISEDVRVLSGLQLEVRARAWIFSGRDVFFLYPRRGRNCSALGTGVGIIEVAFDEERVRRHSIVFAAGPGRDLDGARAVDLHGPGGRPGPHIGFARTHQAKQPALTDLHSTSDWLLYNPR